MTNIWRQNGNCVAALAPGRDDLFVVTLLFGKPVLVEPVADYERALRVAEAFADQMAQPRPVTIKVLGMSLREVLAFMGMTPAEFAAGMSSANDDADRKLVVDTCMAALRECNEPAVRKDAYDLLTKLGVIKP